MVRGAPPAQGIVQGNSRSLQSQVSFQTDFAFLFVAEEESLNICSFRDVTTISKGRVGHLATLTTSSPRRFPSAAHAHMNQTEMASRIEILDG